MYKCQNSYKLIEDTNKSQTDEPDNYYYFNDNYDIYIKCHQYCESCSQGQKYFNDELEIEDTNCDECIVNYININKKIRYFKIFY